MNDNGGINNPLTQVELSSKQEFSSVLIALFLAIGVIITYIYASSVYHFPLSNFGSIFNLVILCIALGLPTYFTNRYRKKLLDSGKRRLDNTKANGKKLNLLERIALDSEVKLAAFLFIILSVLLFIFSYALALLTLQAILWIFVTIVVTSLMTGANAYPVHIPISEEAIKEALSNSRIHLRIVSQSILVFAAGTVFVFYSEILPKIESKKEQRIFSSNDVKEQIELSAIIINEFDSLQGSTQNDSLLELETIHYPYFVLLKDRIVPVAKSIQLSDSSTVMHQPSIVRHANVVFPFILFSYWILGLVIGLWGPVARCLNWLTGLIDHIALGTATKDNQFPVLSPPSYPQEIREPNYKPLIQNLEKIAQLNQQPEHLREILVLFDHLIITHEEADDLLIAKARLLKSMDSLVAAHQILDRVLSKNSDNPQALFDKSQVLFALAKQMNGLDVNTSEKYRNEALELLSKANSLTGEKDPRMLTSLGYAMWSHEDYNEALEKTELAERNCLADNERQLFIIYNNLAYYNIELALIKSEDIYFEKAEEYCEKLRPFLDKDFNPPKTSSEEYDTLAYVELVRFKLTRNKNVLNDALLYVSKSLERDPKNRFAFRHKHEILELLRK